MIVRLDGGLGNQAFEFAFGRSLSLAKNEELFFEKFELDDGIHRNYGLDAFNVDVKFTDAAGPQYLEKTFRFDPDVYNAPQGSHFIGCWQTAKYFNEDVIRKEMTLRHPVTYTTSRIAEEILATPNSAFVHVRRGDYLEPTAAAYHGNLGTDYYDTAMLYIREYVPDAKFFLFSDDTRWCQRFEGCHVVETGLPHEDMFLMSLCKHAIIANSTFSWWASWLGDTQANRICIAPERWFLGAQLDYSDVVPERWVKL